MRATWKRAPLAMVTVVGLTVGLGAGCDEPLDPHWACQDTQAYASGCLSGCNLSGPCAGVVEDLDASDMAVVSACSGCLAAEADSGTCRDCATADASSCREALADLLDAPCLAP